MADSGCHRRIVPDRADAIGEMPPPARSHVAVYRGGCTRRDIVIWRSGGVTGTIAGGFMLS